MIEFVWRDGGQGVSAFTSHGKRWWAAFWPVPYGFKLWISGAFSGRWRGSATSEIEAIAILETRLAAEIAYDDPSMPLRCCDRCDEPYHGPAVYCCLACAEADA